MAGGCRAPQRSGSCSRHCRSIVNDDDCWPGVRVMAGGCLAPQKHVPTPQRSLQPFVPTPQRPLPWP
eukprot:1326631-Rhodomonas_salina.1